METQNVTGPKIDLDMDEAEAEARADLRLAVKTLSRFMSGPQIESYVRTINNEIARNGGRNT